MYRNTYIERPTHRLVDVYLYTHTLMQIIVKNTYTDTIRNIPIQLNIRIYSLICRKLQIMFDKRIVQVKFIIYYQNY